MRTSKNSESIHSETFKLFTKYFEVNFDIKRVAIALKKNEKDVENKLKEEIKKLVVDIEGELLREKKIVQPYFINSMMPKVFSELLSFDKILDENTSMHLLTYYRGKYAEFMNNPEAFLLNNCDYRMEIYEAFLKYAKTVNYLSTTQHIQQLEINPIEMGYLEKREDVYNQNEMTMIFNLYKCHMGNINKIYRDMQMKGYRSIKFQRNVIYFKLENLKLIGLYKIYKISAQQWAGGFYLRWKKFIECYCDINEGWPYEMQLRLLEIAVLDNINQNDAKEFTYKMALAFIKKKAERMKPIFEKQGQSVYSSQIRDEKTRKISEERSDD